MLEALLHVWMPFLYEMLYFQLSVLPFRLTAKKYSVHGTSRIYK